MSEMSRHAEFDSAQSPAAGCVDGPAAGSGGAAPGSDNVRRPIGVVRDVAGGTTHIVLDPQRLQECLGDADPAIAMSGQVASSRRRMAEPAMPVAPARNTRLPFRSMA